MARLLFVFFAASKFLPETENPAAGLMPAAGFVDGLKHAASGKRRVFISYQSDQTLHTQRDNCYHKPAAQPKDNRTYSIFEQALNVGVQSDPCHCNHNSEFAQIIQPRGNLFRKNSL